MLSIHTVDTFNALINLFKEILPSYSVEAIHTKFKLAKQEDGETIKAYVQRVEKLAHN